MLEEEMLEKKVWAVAGASDNQDKYGNRIFKRLREKGYTVYPINPNYEEIEGVKCYPNLKALPEKPDVIDMVVNPKHGIGVVKEAAELGIKNIWLQPGTVSDELLSIASELGIQTVQACVLVALTHPR